MNMSSRKRILSGPLACVAGLSALLSAICCFAFASASAMAAPAGEPPEGTACNSTDGKIDGRGSTYQEEAQQKTFSVAYTQTFCAMSVPTEFSGDPAEHTMVAYNYPNAKEKSVTGSGAGIRAASCRTDAFSGTDLPYSNSELSSVLDGPVGASGTCTIATGFEPPFTPKSPWPSPEDKETKVMSFPIAGSSVAIMVHLTSAECGGHAPPTSFTFTALELSRIFGGDALTWNDAELVENNPGLSNCTASIQRVVREDNSGTTSIFKSYLIRVDNGRTSPAGTCAPGKTWETYFPSPNTNWPHSSEGGTCSPEAIHGEKSGNPELIAKLKETPNGIGYADLPQAINQTGIVLASVRNATNASYQPPNVSKTANCNYSVLSLPGLNAEESVGLNLEDNWSNNNEKLKSEGGNEEPQHGNATDLGSKYPICGLTWDLVYTHDESSSNSQVAIKRLTADQRMTEYAYFSFILSSAGQDLLNEVYYASLPATWIKTLREGFQANF